MIDRARRRTTAPLDEGCPNSRRRRSLLKGFAGALAAGTPASAVIATIGRARPQVVVLGGGAGGATVARQLAREADGRLDVTLIEPKQRYTSCFYSNLYLGGYRDWSSITHAYDDIARDAPLERIPRRALAVEPDRRRVILEAGVSLHYDRLVVAPGIDILHEGIPGYAARHEHRAPHAWRGGEQLRTFKRQLERLRDGSTVVIVAPPDPSRCPPGPYERASLIARLFQRRRHRRSRVVILDTKSSFAKQSLFMAAWERYYPGAIEWYPPEVHGGILRLDVKRGEVYTDLDVFRGELLNPIPPQSAAAIAFASGLADESGFCPVEAGNMRSSKARDVYVLGDAAIAGDMPKSAFAANSQARVVAQAIRHDLLDDAIPDAVYANTCWSLLADDDAVKVGARYGPRAGTIRTIESFLSKPGEPAAVRRATYRQSVDWYTSITREMFGPPA